jgi:hypothetical protein
MASDNGEKKPNVDDISLEDARPAKKPGGGGLGWLILVIVVVAVAWFAYSSYARKQQAEAEAKAKADAAMSRVAQTGAANDNVREALTLAEQGNMPAAIAKLQAAESLYGMIIGGANEAGDQEAASKALADRGAIQDSRQALELEQQRFQENVKLQLDALRANFGIPAAQAPLEAGTQPAPASEASGAAEQPAADAEQQPATEAQPPAATGSEPVAPSAAVPATGTEPAAPSAATPATGN